MGGAREGGRRRGGREKSKLLTKQALKKVDGSSLRMTGSPLRTRNLTSVTAETWGVEGAERTSHT